MLIDLKPTNANPIEYITEDCRNIIIYWIAIWYQTLNKFVNHGHAVCPMKERYANLSSVVSDLGEQLLANYDKF